jgi:hypothetical protein
VPVADTGVGLPRFGEDAVGAAAFEIQHQRTLVLGLRFLALSTASK